MSVSVTSRFRQSDRVGKNVQKVVLAVVMEARPFTDVIVNRKQSA